MKGRRQTKKRIQGVTVVNAQTYLNECILHHYVNGNMPTKMFEKPDRDGLKPYYNTTSEQRTQCAFLLDPVIKVIYP